jgi:predicted O-methyltransferase YrrM
MLKALGPDLGVEATWAASDAPAEGDLASIFASTDNIHKWPHYLPVYELALSPFRSRPIRILEIGVARGGSLQMWRRYLHPESVIVGIDIDPAARRFDDPLQGQHVRIGDQQDVPFLRRVVSEFGQFDVIVDDGSHMTSHIVNTFRHLFPNALSPGGVYIVEDIHSNYWTEYRDSAMSFVDFTKWLIDAMHAHYLVTDSELKFRVGDSHRLPEVKVPVATMLLEKVEFYDSIAVMHRAHGRRELPRTIYHVNGAGHTPETSS